MNTAATVTMLTAPPSSRLTPMTADSGTPSSNAPRASAARPLLGLRRLGLPRLMTGALAMARSPAGQPHVVRSVGKGADESADRCRGKPCLLVGLTDQFEGDR